MKTYKKRTLHMPIPLAMFTMFTCSQGAQLLYMGVCVAYTPIYGGCGFLALLTLCTYVNLMVGASLVCPVRFGAGEGG